MNCADLKKGAWIERPAGVLQTLLVQTSTRDSVTLGSIAVLMIAVAIAASFWPARRATRLDPVSALRCE